MKHNLTDSTQILEFNKILAELKHDQLDGLDGETVDAVIEPVTAEASFDLKNVFSAALSSVFSVLPRWEVQATEIDALSDSYTQLVEYWFPDLTTNLSPPANAGVTTGLFAMRVFGTLSQNKEIKNVNSEDERANFY